MVDIDYLWILYRFELLSKQLQTKSNKTKLNLTNPPNKANCYQFPAQNQNQWPWEGPKIARMQPMPEEYELNHSNFAITLKPQ